MCGIVAYLGKKEAYNILLDGLKRLEYRGYDSAGIALITPKGNTIINKKKGKVANLELSNNCEMSNATIGIGHTRWATHGKPSDLNAHPHISNDEDLILIHNGIIENYDILKKFLVEQSYTFYSETDTEVLVNLISYYKKNYQLSFTSAIRKALSKVIGAYAIVVMEANNPDILIGARKSSPLVVGVGNNEYLVGSDASPIINYTDQVIYLEDETIITMRRNGTHKITDLNDNALQTEIRTVDLKIEQLEKGGYPHFMLKEIHQQAESVKDAMRGRVSSEENWIKMAGIDDHLEYFKRVDRIIILSCGTSYHAGLIGEYLIEDLVRIPVEVEYASEFRYRNPVLRKNDLVIAISQSGETADTLAALKLAKDKGIMTYGIVNVVGSSIARLSDCGSYIHAGPEIGVASTKAFTGQITLLSIFALRLAMLKETLTQAQTNIYIKELEQLPDKIKNLLENIENIKNIASEIKAASNALYLGRGYCFPVALEGALKLKEISYIHAEGYPAAEMKHGPIALIDMFMPVVVIATNQSAYEKILSNIQEVKSRKGMIISIVEYGDSRIKEISDFCIEIPKTLEIFTPILANIPLQLMAYYIAIMRGCDVDQPRNLAKSVTVE